LVTNGTTHREVRAAGRFHLVKGIAFASEPLLQDAECWWVLLFGSVHHADPVAQRMCLLLIAWFSYCLMSASGLVMSIIASRENGV